MMEEALEGAAAQSTLQLSPALSIATPLHRGQSLGTEAQARKIK
jgi:hypothetical protein